MYARGSAWESEWKSVHEKVRENERKVDAPGRGSRRPLSPPLPLPPPPTPVPRPRPRIPKTLLPVLLIDSLLSAKKWYWSTMIIYVIIRPRCYRRTVFNKNFIWTKKNRGDDIRHSLNQFVEPLAWNRDKRIEFYKRVSKFVEKSKMLEQRSRAVNIFRSHWSTGLLNWTAGGRLVKIRSAYFDVFCYELYLWG